MDDLIEMLSLFTHDHNLIITVAINYLLNPIHIVHYPDYLHVVCYQGYLSIIEFVRYYLSYLFDIYRLIHGIFHIALVISMRP